MTLYRITDHLDHDTVTLTADLAATLRGLDIDDDETASAKQYYRLATDALIASAGNDPVAAAALSITVATVDEIDPDDLDWHHHHDHSTDYESESATVDDHRVTLRVDFEPMPPSDWDGGVPVVSIHSGRGTDTYADADQVRYARDYFDNDDELLTRYLRMFHGATVVEFSGPLGHPSGPVLVAFDTPEWRTMTGWTPGAGGNPAVETLTEWRQYYENDVYGVTVEQRRTGTTTWQDGTVEDVEDWEELDLTCWGLYGYDYARQEAARMLTEALS